MSAISANGKAVNPPTTRASKVDAHVADQTLALSETQKAQGVADSWRRVASGAILAIIGLVLAIVILATRYQHDVFVYQNGSHGLTFEGQAAQVVTPSQGAIEAQIGAFVKAYRNVPGLDYALDDQNVLLALQMTVDVAPQHAHQDTVAHFTDKANNPKLLGQSGTIRTVLDPVIVSPISEQTYTVSWAEEVTTVGHASRRDFHQGTVMIAPPVIPTDAAIAATNPAGVAIIQKDLHL